MTNLTAVVISYNRRDVIETCLRGARFADRLVVIDKGSSDGTAEIGQRYADEFHSATWSPTVESTRSTYFPQIEGDWMLMLDDDECLNAQAISYVQQAVEWSHDDIHFLPLRHYVLGRHDERAYYWPESHCRLFRRGTIEFSATVHGGLILLSEKRASAPLESGAAIMHLSHPDSRTWIEKTNRYTDQRDRAVLPGSPRLTPDVVRRLMDEWLKKVSDEDDEYLTAVAALRGLYDIVDLIKIWEQQQGDGAGKRAFAGVCEELDRVYDRLGIPRLSNHCTA